jgi:hypothetical protein
LSSFKDAEDEALEEEVEYIPYPYSMTSYGADYTVDGLVKRIQQGDILVPPFQRSFVWSYLQASRFVESLLLGLPVPGVFLSREYGSEKMLVIDGQQRLRTLQFFYDGIFGLPPSDRPFTLKGVQPELEGKTYETLDPEEIRRLNDSIIHATIVKQDKPEKDNSSIYYIFQRLNTGGTQLMPQEIRSCIFQGEFNDLLKELNTNATWRAIYGSPSTRMRDEELILRFFALYYYIDSYARPMNHFLNVYMGNNRHFEVHSKRELTSLFQNTVETAANFIGTSAFKLERGVMSGIFDSVGVGIARRLRNGPITKADIFRAKYEALLGNGKYIEAVTRSTSDERNVHLRIELAIKAFADIP